MLLNWDYTRNTDFFCLKLFNDYYTNIGKEGHSYKVRSAYKLDLSDEFYTIVLNVFKGDYELETVLINYSLEAELTAYKVIAYDEMAEGWARKYTDLDNSIITVIGAIYGEDTQLDTAKFYISGIGKINPIKTEFSSDLRPGKVIILNQIYTDTIEFLSYNDDYDYRVLQGIKNGHEVNVIYNWDWMDNEKYNFKIGERIKVKWEMDRIVHAGDEDILDFSERAIEAERVTSESKAQGNSLSQGINYFEFNPDKIQNAKLSNFDIDYAYQLEDKKIVAGYDKKANPDTEKDWGDKLLLLNNENEILFKSYGVGDVYLFEPHFYKNRETDKIVIICQLGFEYFCGGEAFVYENGNITSIGSLDIESDNGEKSLIDIVEVNEIDNRIVFTFKSESLVLEPGSENILIKNTGVKYIYENKKLTLVK